MACLWELEMTQHYRVTKVLGDKLSIQGQCNNQSGPESRVCPRVLLSPCSYQKPYCQPHHTILSLHNSCPESFEIECPIGA